MTMQPERVRNEIPRRDINTTEHPEGDWALWPFLQRTSDFEAMNAAYAEMMGEHRPARTVFSVKELPKPGVLVTMNLTAVTHWVLIVRIEVGLA